LQFKGQGPFKSSKECSAAKHESKIYRLLLTNLGFRWTGPLNILLIFMPCSIEQINNIE
jgi:hypothetical protein